MKRINIVIEVGQTKVRMILQHTGAIKLNVWVKKSRPCDEISLQ